MKKAIGTRIRKLRELKDYTQDNMATELEITAGAYAKIERGETDPSATRLIQIAEILGVEVAYFFQQPALALNTVNEPQANYGQQVSQNAIDHLTQLIELLRKDMEKMKAELAILKQRKSKK